MAENLAFRFLAAEALLVVVGIQLAVRARSFVTDTLASVHFAVELPVADHAARKLLAALSALVGLAAVTSRLHHDWTRRTVAFVANLIASMDLAVQRAVARLATCALVQFTANSFFCLFATEAVDQRNEDVARRTYTAMAGFTARVDA